MFSETPDHARYPAATFAAMDLLTLYGVLALCAMLITSALEPRSPSVKGQLAHRGGPTSAETLTQLLGTPQRMTSTTGRAGRRAIAYSDQAPFPHTARRPAPCATHGRLGPVGALLSVAASLSLLRDRRDGRLPSHMTAVVQDASEPRVMVTGPLTEAMLLRATCQTA